MKNYFGAYGKAAVLVPPFLVESGAPAKYTEHNTKIFLKKPKNLLFIRDFQI